MELDVGEASPDFGVGSKIPLGRAPHTRPYGLLVVKGSAAKRHSLVMYFVYSENVSDQHRLLFRKKCGFHHTGSIMHYCCSLHM